MDEPTHVKRENASGFEPCLITARDERLATSRAVWLCLAIFGLTMILMLLSGIRQGWFTPSTHVYLTLPGASGLQVGTQVRLRGFPIGEIDELELQGDLTVRTRIQIDHQRMPLLSADTLAQVGRDTPVAARHIDLFPNPQQPTRLAAGQSLRLKEGQEIEDLLQTAKQLMLQVNRTLEKAQPILENVEDISTEVAQTMPVLRQSLEKMALHAQSTARQVDLTTQTIGSAVEDLSGKREVWGREMGEILSNTRQTSNHVEAVLNAIRKDLPPVLRAGNQIAGDAADLTQGLKQTWPFSSLLKQDKPVEAGLDGFEGSKP